MRDSVQYPEFMQYFYRIGLEIDADTKGLYFWSGLKHLCINTLQMQSECQGEP